MAASTAVRPIEYRRFVDMPREAIAVWRTLRDPDNPRRVLVKMEDLPPFFIDETYLGCATDPVIDRTMDDIVRLSQQIDDDLAQPIAFQRLLAAAAGQDAEPATRRVRRDQVVALFRHGLGRS